MAKKKDLSVGFNIPAPPPRTEVSEEEAEHFISDKQRETDSESSENLTSPVPQAERTPSRKKREKQGERMTIYLPPEISERLRVRCAKERRSLSDAVTEAVDKWLS